MDAQKTKVVCSECGCGMEFSVEVDKEEYLVRHYYKWECPKCGHIHIEED